MLGIRQVDGSAGGRVAEAPDVDTDVDDRRHVLGQQPGDLAVEREGVVLAAQVVGERREGRRGPVSGRPSPDRRSWLSRADDPPRRMTAGSAGGSARRLATICRRWMRSLLELVAAGRRGIVAGGEGLRVRGVGARLAGEDGRAGRRQEGQRREGGDDERRGGASGAGVSSMPYLLEETRRSSPTEASATPRARARRGARGRRSRRWAAGPRSRSSPTARRASWRAPGSSAVYRATGASRARADDRRVARQLEQHRAQAAAPCRRRPACSSVVRLVA